MIALPRGPEAGAWYLAILIALPVLWRIVAPFIWPNRPCRRCHGGGKFPAPDGVNWRWCRKCGGTGHKIRFGRRIWGKSE